MTPLIQVLSLVTAALISRTMPLNVFSLFYLAALLVHGVLGFSFGINRWAQARERWILMLLVMSCFLGSFLTVFYWINMVQIIIGIHVIWTEIYARKSRKIFSGLDEVRSIAYFLIYASLALPWTNIPASYAISIAIACLFVSGIPLANAKDWQSVISDTIWAGFGILCLMLSVQVQVIEVVFYHIVTWFFIGTASRGTKMIFLHVLPIAVCLLGLFFIGAFAWPRGHQGWYMSDVIVSTVGFFHVTSSLFLTDAQPEWCNRLFGLAAPELEK